MYHNNHWLRNWFADTNPVFPSYSLPFQGVPVPFPVCHNKATRDAMLVALQQEDNIKKKIKIIYCGKVKYLVDLSVPGKVIL